MVFRFRSSLFVNPDPSTSEVNQSRSGQTSAASNWIDVGTANLHASGNGTNNYSGLDESYIKSMTLNKSRRQQAGQEDRAEKRFVVGKFVFLSENLTLAIQWGSE